MKRDSLAQWSLLGWPPHVKLTEARLQAHFACQITAAFGAAYITRREDLGHIGMTWSRGQRAFVTGVAMGPRRVRMALNLPRFEIYAMEPVGSQGILERLNLRSATLESASKWMRKTAARFGFDPEVMKFDFGQTPEHPLKGGGAFTFDGGEEEMEELIRYFSNADLLLNRLCDGGGESSPAQIWPGNFAVSSLHSFSDEAGHKRSIEIGLSPCGGEMDAPYFYANLYPAPKSHQNALPPQSGKWRQDGWTGVTLDASEFAPPRAVEQQMENAERFLRSALLLLKSL